MCNLGSEKLGELRELCLGRCFPSTYEDDRTKSASGSSGAGVDPMELRPVVVRHDMGTRSCRNTAPRSGLDFRHPTDETIPFAAHGDDRAYLATGQRPPREHDGSRDCRLADDGAPPRTLNEIRFGHEHPARFDKEEDHLQNLPRQAQRLTIPPQLEGILVSFERALACARA